MDDAISEYQKWKRQGESLRSQAKQAMETRFRDLLTEAAEIAHEYQRDFGSALKPPSTVTAFRFKTGAVKGKPAAKPATGTRQPEAAKDPKLVILEKRRLALQKKIDGARAAGKPTKNLDDKLYEVDDEIRLASAR